MLLHATAEVMAMVTRTVLQQAVTCHGFDDVLPIMQQQASW